jgi:capsular exopolysaccharide synthesis family protein
MIVARTYEALLKAEREGQIKSDSIPFVKPQIKSESIPFIKPESHPKPERTVKLGDSSKLLQEFDRIRDHVLLNDVKGSAKTLLFSSPKEGEGNSTILINFVISLARDGEKVIVVDGNVRNPSLHERLNLERKPGLTDLVLGEVTLKDVLRETRFNNLLAITCGMPLSNPSAILGSKSLEVYIEEMKAHGDWVVFDSPAINSFNDAAVLAGKVDGVVMVIQAEKTRWEVAQKAKERIESGNGRILGAVLNDRRYHIPGWLYRTL